MKINKKTMTRTINIFIALLFFGSAFGQDDKAKKILDELGEKTKAYRTVTVSFSIVITNPEDGSEPIKRRGKAYLKGEKYKIELNDQDVYCDGETITTHIKEDKECYTSAVDEQEEGAVTPSNMLTIWEDDFNYEYKRETTFNEIPVHQIHLYPRNPRDRNFHTIILKVDKAKMQILSVYIKGNDGQKMRYIVKTFESNKELADSKFVFDRSKFPEVECYEE